jgi:hypothetical protein
MRYFQQGTKHKAQAPSLNGQRPGTALKDRARKNRSFQGESLAE